MRANTVFIGNGSDEAIDLLIRICCRPGTEDHILTCPPTYGMYEVSAAVNDVPVVGVPLGKDFQLDLQGIRSALTSATKLVFLCSPNNPTGNLLRRDDIESILAAAPGLVVIDEAYIDFSSETSWLAVLADYPNLLVLQTCSKAWGMAGLRIGMAFADPALVAILSNVKPPYNIPAPSQELALERLSDEASFERSLAELIAQRERMLRALKLIPWIRMVFPSDANFLLVRVPDADRLYAFLLEHGIVVRNRNTTPGCAGCIRITIGNESENNRLLQTLESYPA